MSIKFALISISRKSPAGAQPAKLLTKDEARRIAANIAKLPEGGFFLINRSA